MSDNVSVEQAVRDLLSDIRKSKRGWNVMGTTEEISGHWENGVRIISYTFDAKEPAHSYHDHLTNVARMNQVQRDAVAHVLGEIEKVSNIKFRLVGHLDDIAKADIRLLQGKILGPGYVRPGGGYTINGSIIRDVILSDNAPDESFGVGKQGYGTVAHEVLHALGLSHPNGDGNNPSYSKDSTALCYNPGRLRVEGIGPFDVAALQYLYGKPAGEPASRVITNEDLQTSSVIYASSPVVLKIDKGSGLDNILCINMGSERFSEQITGCLEDPSGRETIPIGVRLAPGTQIKDVLSNPRSRVALRVVGNSLSNTIQGGAWDDVLTPRGGDDVLTGNGGKDRFVLCPDSGKNNRVTDFNPLEDTLCISNSHRPELRQVSEGQVTEVLIKSNNGTVVASMLLANETLPITPDQVRYVFDKVSNNDTTIPITLQSTLPTCGAAHPTKAGSALRMNAKSRD